MSEEKVVKKPVRRPARKKVCNFCVDKVEAIDYKDISKLRKYITEKGKIIPRVKLQLLSSVQDIWLFCLS